MKARANKLLSETIAEIIFNENMLYPCFEHEDEDGQTYILKWDNISPDDFTRYLLVSNNDTTTRYKIRIEVSKSRMAK